jgi:excisionase family DNA binding protein
VVARTSFNELDDLMLFVYFEWSYAGVMSTDVSEPTTVFPPTDVASLVDVSRSLEELRGSAILLGPDGQRIPLPVEAYQVLLKVVDAMRAGKAITITPMDQQLTTQQAADLLGISRPTFVKLLVRGEIPYEQPTGSRHRRVRLRDVLDYQRRNRVGRRATLDKLTAEAAEAGLYDNVPDYTQALRAARRRPVG